MCWQSLSKVGFYVHIVIYMHVYVCIYNIIYLQKLPRWIDGVCKMWTAAKSFVLENIYYRLLASLQPSMNKNTKIPTNIFFCLLFYVLKVQEKFQLKHCGKWSTLCVYHIATKMSKYMPYIHTFI